MNKSITKFSTVLFIAFSVFLIPSVQAAASDQKKVTQEIGNQVCKEDPIAASNEPGDINVYIEQMLVAEKSEKFILQKLVKCNQMNLREAVDALIAAGTDLKPILVAALSIDPNFEYSDPTAGLNPTASGGESSGSSSTKGSSAIGAGTGAGGAGAALDG